MPNKDKTMLDPSHIWFNKDVKKTLGFTEATKKTSFSKGDGLPGRVWKTMKPVWIVDVYKEEYFTRAKYCKSLGIRGAVGFPVICNNEIVAVLEFFSYDSEAKDKRIIELFDLLSEHVGHVLERKKHEEEKEYLAHYDQLTKLPNRHYFHEVLDNVFQRAIRLEKKFAVFFIDVDNFKQINDGYGHACGDALLVEISVRIKKVIRDMDYVARIGGDEFIIIQDEISSSNEAAMLASRINVALAELYIIDGNEFHSTASIGICMFPKTSAKSGDILKYADRAMYASKMKKRGSFQFYTSELNKHNERISNITSHLHSALVNNEFRLVYQPQVNLENGGIIGMEVLLRWCSPDFGDVTPDEFIPIAEATGSILPISEWAYSEAIKQFSIWEKQFNLEGVCISINCSTVQMQDQKLKPILSNLLNKYDVSSDQIVLEITENVFLQNTLQAQENINHVSSLGIRFAIDDFGTGYSSLGYLKELPISILKVDKKFIDNILDNESDKAIVEASIQLCKSMRFEIIAEGVEVQEQANYLLKHGCTFAQGHLFSRPLGVEDMSKFLKKVLL